MIFINNKQEYASLHYNFIFRTVVARQLNETGVHRFSNVVDDELKARRNFKGKLLKRDFFNYAQPT